MNTLAALSWTSSTCEGPLSQEDKREQEEEERKPQGTLAALVQQLPLSRYVCSFPAILRLLFVELPRVGLVSPSG